MDIHISHYIITTLFNAISDNASWTATCSVIITMELSLYFPHFITNMIFSIFGLKNLSHGYPSLSSAITRAHVQWTSILARWSRYFVTSALQRIKSGHLVINDAADHQIYTFGRASKSPASLIVKDNAMWSRVLLSSSVVSNIIKESFDR